jgi:hypothetical protein
MQCDDTVLSLASRVFLARKPRPLRAWQHASGSLSLIDASGCPMFAGVTWGISCSLDRHRIDSPSLCGSVYLCSV